MTRVIIGGLVAGREWALAKYIQSLAELDTHSVQVEYLFVRDRAAERDMKERSPLTGLPKLPYFLNFEDCSPECGFLSTARPNYSFERLGILRNLWLDYAWNRLKADYCFLVDSDISLAPDALVKLLRHFTQSAQHQQIVAAPVRNSTASKVFNFQWAGQDDLGDRTYTRTYTTDIDFNYPFKVDLTGAATLIPASCFNAVKWWGDDRKRLGEDFGFAENCSDNNIELWVEPNISTTHHMREGLSLTHTPGDIARAYERA